MTNRNQNQQKQKELTQEIARLDRLLHRNGFYPRAGVILALIGGKAKKLQDENQAIWTRKKELELELAQLNRKPALICGNCQSAITSLYFWNISKNYAECERCYYRD
jgi:hypothetical protein